MPTKDDGNESSSTVPPSAVGAAASTIDGDDDSVIEEKWTNTEGMNVFDAEVFATHQLTRIPLPCGSGSHTAQRLSAAPPIPSSSSSQKTDQEANDEDDRGVPEDISALMDEGNDRVRQTPPDEINIHRISRMSPLDMNYSTRTSMATDNDNHNASTKYPLSESAEDDEFYDGTGHMIWMAAVAFLYILRLDCEKALHTPHEARGLPGGSDRGKDGHQREHKRQQEPRQYSSYEYILQHIGRRICELGCGTGAASIAVLVLLGQHIVERVLFTDNDQATLELCEKNIRSNVRGGDGDGGGGGNDAADAVDDADERYNTMLLPWGMEHMNTLYSDGHGAFDTVIATDVVYDLKMVNPMLETAAALLRDDGILILSHVPRFYLPRPDSNVSNNGHHTDDECEPDDRVNTKHTECGPMGENEAMVSEDGGGNRHTRRKGHLPFQALEQHIIHQAAEHGLECIREFRPHQVLPSHHDDYLAEMETARGGDTAETVSVTRQQLEAFHSIIMIFRKTATQT